MPDSRGRETRAEKRGHTPRGVKAEGRTRMLRGKEFLPLDGAGAAPDERPAKVLPPPPAHPDGAEWSRVDGLATCDHCSGQVRFERVGTSLRAACGGCRREWMRRASVDPWQRGGR